MSTATSAKVTPQELLDLPDDGRIYELVDGELVEVPMGTESTRLASEVIYHLKHYSKTIQPGWVIGVDAGFQIFADDPDRIRKPDVAYISFARLPVESYQPSGYWRVAPELVVEILSPNDLAQAVDAKTDEWLAAGVDTVWVIQPDNQSIRIHRRDGTYDFLRAADQLTAPAILPGFSVPVAELFRLPGKPFSDIASS